MTPIEPMLPEGALAKLLAPTAAEKRKPKVAPPKDGKKRGKKGDTPAVAEGADPDGPAYGEDEIATKAAERAVAADRKRRGVRAEADPEAEASRMPRDPGACPIRAIGLGDGIAYFFDRYGQLRRLNAQALGQSSQIYLLFGGLAGADWLRNKFPHFDREGVWTKGFTVRDCNIWLIEQCGSAGLFDPEKLPIRGHGVWLAQGIIAVHVGNNVIFMGDEMEIRPAGFRDRGALWPAKPELTPPAPALPAELAQQVERMFGKWHWWNLGEERVFTGLWASGLLGAAINWRPHGLLVGPAGTGKSTLLELYEALSPLAMAVNDYTAAGVRQLLSGRAAPLILDEADEDPETMGRLQQVISLLRRASSGQGARAVRGSGEGTATRSAFMSPAMMGCVLAPPLMPQDATRITKMELVRIPDGADPLPIERMMQWSHANAAALWGRAIDGIPRFRRNLAIMRKVLMGKGCSPRLSDQLGTILAARAMMMEDEPLDYMAAEEDALAVSWLLQTHDQAIEDGGSMRCLQHLLNSQADVLESGQRPTFERLIARARSQQDDDARRKLIDHGLKLANMPRGATVESLLVSRSHPALSKVFAGTLWAGSRWADDLKHLPGAFLPPDPISLRAGVKPRVVVIPLDNIASDDAAEASQPAPVGEYEDIPL